MSSCEFLAETEFCCDLHLLGILCFFFLFFCLVFVSFKNILGFFLLLFEGTVVLYIVKTLFCYILLAFLSFTSSVFI